MAGHLTIVMFSCIFDATYWVIQSVQKEWVQLVFVNISPDGFVSIQISQKLLCDDWPFSLMMGLSTFRMCEEAFCKGVLGGFVGMRADMRASCNCNSSAYFSSEIGKISSWSWRAEKQKSSTYGRSTVDVLAANITFIIKKDVNN